MVRACWLVPLSHRRWLTRAVASLGSRVWLCRYPRVWRASCLCPRYGYPYLYLARSLARFQRELTLCIGVCVQWLRPKSFLSQVCTPQPEAMSAQRPIGIVSRDTASTARDDCRQWGLGLRGFCLRMCG